MGGGHCLFSKCICLICQLPSLFRRREMLRGTLKLFIKSTTLTSLRAVKEKGEGAKITVNRTTVIFHTAEFTSKGHHQIIVTGESLCHFTQEVLPRWRDDKRGLHWGNCLLVSGFFKQTRNIIINQSSSVIKKHNFTVLWSNGRGCDTAASERHCRLCFSLQLDKSTDTSDTA